MKLIFDTETTGLNPEVDEILQFSAIDEYGNTLLNAYIKPSHTESWEIAMAINGITPEMVANKPCFDFYKDQIQWLFDRADELVSYNGIFDIKMLRSHGIKISDDIKHYDVMRAFAPIYGEIRKNKETGEEVFKEDGTPVYKWKKLSECAAYYGFKFKAHDSMEDIKATLYCYEQIVKNKEE